MPDFTARPKIELVLDGKAYLQKVWSQTHGHWTADLDPLYFRTYDQWPENKGRPKYRPATPTSIVDRASTAQIVSVPKINRSPRGKSQKDREMADTVEEGLSLVVKDSALGKAVIPAYQLRFTYLNFLYYTVGEVDFTFTSRPRPPVRAEGDTDDLHEARTAIYEAHHRNWNPFTIRSPHPASVLLDPEQPEPDYALKFESMKAQDLYEMSKRKDSTPVGKRRGVKVFDMQGHTPFQAIEVIHWWTKHHHAVIAQNEILWIDPNWWGFVPFTHAFNGHGLMPTSLSVPGQGTVGFDPRPFCEGILGPIAESIIMQSQREASFHSMLMRAAYPPRYTEGDLSPEELANVEATGGYAQATRGSIWSPEDQQVANWMFQVGQNVDSDIMRGSFPLPDVRQPGVTTVGQQAILSNALSRQFQGAVDQLQRMATREAMGILAIVDGLSMNSEVSRIGLNGKYLDAKDIAHDYSVDAIFDDIDPMLQLQGMEFGLREITAGVLSKERYWRERARLQNVTGERTALREDGIRSDADVNAILSEDTADEIGLGEEYQEALRRKKERGDLRGQALQGETPENESPTIGMPEQGTQNAMRGALGPNTQNPPRLG